jgi:hypothetical protein
MARASSRQGVSADDEEWVDVDLSFDDEHGGGESVRVDPSVAEAVALLAVIEHADQWRAGVDAALREELDGLFAGARTDALAAAEQTGRSDLQGVTALLEREEFDLACRTLERTLCVPAVRFEAASLLAQIRTHCGDPLNALSILLWASEFPPPADRAVAHDFAYQLGAVFETLGMRKEALDIFRELVAEAGVEYRDAGDKIERLAGA